MSSLTQFLLKSDIQNLMPKTENLEDIAKQEKRQKKAGLILEEYKDLILKQEKDLPTIDQIMLKTKEQALRLKTMDKGYNHEGLKELAKNILENELERKIEIKSDNVYVPEKPISHKFRR